MSKLHKILLDRTLTSKDRFKQFKKVFNINPSISLTETDVNGFSILFITTIFLRGDKSYKDIYSFLIQNGAKNNEKDNEADLNLFRARQQGLLKDLFNNSC